VLLNSLDALILGVVAVCVGGFLISITPDWLKLVLVAVVLALIILGVVVQVTGND
jgi:hypothetical protein